MFKQYADVFPEELPKQLPPQRTINDVHKIQVQAGCKPIAKAPYRQGPE